MTTVANSDVINGAFIYAGNSVVFTGGKPMKALLPEQEIIIEDGDKPPLTVIVKEVRKVSIWYYEVRTWIKTGE